MNEYKSTQENKNMKTLSEFNTLLDAQQYEHTTYKTLNGNEASQILSVMGALDAIENNQNSTEEVTLVPGSPTTIGALCRSVIRTMQGGKFATDPNTDDGQMNRAASSSLVAAGVLTSVQDSAFYSRAETKTTPYSNKTEYDFKLAKGTLTTVPAQLSALCDSVVITTTSDCPRHSPRITDENGVIVDYLRNVSVAGIYVTTIKPEYRGKTLFVDDAYGVM